MTNRRNQAGFGIVEILIVVVVVGVIGTAGWLLYRHHHKTMSSSTPPTSQTGTKPSVSSNTKSAQTATQAMSTYTSTSGGFSFQYPSDWNVAESKVGLGDELTVGPSAANTVTNGKATPNIFTMAFNIDNKPNSPFSSSRIKNGTTQTSSNSINLWTSTEASATDSTQPAGRTVCPELLIMSTDKSSFNYALPNGSYLTLEAGYCEGQGANTSLTYQQQVASQDWQDALAIVQSIKFQ